jgi:hypothetical protein
LILGVCLRHQPHTSCLEINYRAGSPTWLFTNHYYLSWSVYGVGIEVHLSSTSPLRLDPPRRMWSIRLIPHTTCLILLISLADIALLVTMVISFASEKIAWEMACWIAWVLFLTDACYHVTKMLGRRSGITCRGIGRGHYMLLNV